jgi:hypothetical protein
VEGVYRLQRGSWMPELPSLDSDHPLTPTPETCQKPDTLSSFSIPGYPPLPLSGAPFPLLGEQAEPVNPRCIGELIVPVGSSCASYVMHTCHL